MDKVIKIVLAILLFLCLLNMPYAFYQIVRFLGFFGFIYLAYIEFQYVKEIAAIGYVDFKTKYLSIITFIILALLFQPIYKISLGRELWNVIDVIVGAGLIFSIFAKPKTDN